MTRSVCSICGYVYDEGRGCPDAGIAPGTVWKEVPESWVCPVCGAAKSEFSPQQPEGAAAAPAAAISAEPVEALRELSYGELSALCSNLARGCEKQYRSEEAGCFRTLAEYYQNRAGSETPPDPGALLARVDEDLNRGFPAANGVAQSAGPDRGALRALVWSEKVTRILRSLLERCQSEGCGFLNGTHVFVCDICGFVFVGDTPPALCPVCKVPGWKFQRIEGRIRE